MSAADAAQVSTARVAGAVDTVGTDGSSGTAPLSARDQLTAPATHDTSAESIPFTGQIVHNRDGSLVIVDADVPWVSEPDSIVDDGSGRAPSGSVPPVIRSVLFIRRRRGARADRTDAGVPPGLMVDRYRVCDADDGGGADVACEAAGAAEAGSSAPGRTNVTCCVCRLCFGAAAAFAAHCVDAHGLALDSAPLRLLSRPGAAAVLAATGAERRPAVSVLRFSPCPSDRVADGAAPHTATDSERGATERSGECGARVTQPSAPSDSARAGGSLESLSANRHAVSSAADRSCSAGVMSSVATPDVASAPPDTLPARSLTVFSQTAAVSSASSSTLKTLKCPCCNWHFKYRDTLEVHLREKHPEGSGACGFCLSGQPHPRLSRGEAHDCGYKPYRCDVCHYATTTKGNLSIHMQSDKHLNNVQERQHALRSLCASGQRVGEDGEGSALVGRVVEDGAERDRNPGLRDVVQAKLKTLSDIAVRSPLGEGGTTLGDKIAMLFARQPDMSKQDERSKSVMHPGDVPAIEQPNSSEHLSPRHMFACCTCTTFSTDSLEELEQHVRQERGSARSGDFTSVEGGLQVCLLCSYRTHLRANFMLHCQSDKHLQKLQHLLHILEGGAGNLWQLPYLHATSPIAVRCNICEVSTGIGVQLRVHAADGRHQANGALWAYLRRAEQAVPAGRRRYGCALCGYSARHVLLLLRHTASLLHLGTERRRLVERQRGGGRSEEEEDALCLSVRNAGPDADDDPDEMFLSTELLRQTDGSAPQTNGCARPTLSGIDVNPMRLRQLDPGLSDGQLPAISNGLTKHRAEPNTSSEDPCESKRHSEKRTHEAVESVKDHGEEHRKSRRDGDDAASRSIEAGKARHDRNPKPDDCKKVATNGSADQNDNVRLEEDASRPYKCHACNVSYGHPQILTIHLQSTSHQARAAISDQSLRSSGAEVHPHLGSTRVSGSASGAGASETGLINKYFGETLGAESNCDERKGATADVLETKAEEVLAIKRAMDGHDQVAKQGEQAIDDDQYGHMSGLKNAERPQSRSKHIFNVRKSSPTGRESQTFKDQLLESYGLEFAMHHCESRRKRRKTDAENSTNDGGEKTTVNNPVSKTSGADDYVCPLCQKCFSGLWIFKLHVEEIHHKYVPRELLEVHIEALSTELHRRRQTNSEGTQKDADSRLNETTKASRSEWQTSSEQASPALSGTRADDTTNTTTDPEQSRASSPPAAPQLPMPDIQTALSLIQAAHIRYQMQQLNPLLASQMAALGSPLAAFGLGDTGAQSQQLLSLMAAQQLLNPGMLWAAQAQALAQHQAQAPSTTSSKPTEGKRPADSSAGGGREEKRARTRISGHQLKILRAHFDVDRMPSDEAVEELAKRCSLAPKVVKHWFRNTLFKERQRDKESPYNFSVPPGAPLELTRQGLPDLTVLQSDKLRSSPQRSVTDDGVESESRSGRDEPREATRRTSPEEAIISEEAVDLSSWTSSLAHHTSLTSGRSHNHGSSLLGSSSSPPPAHNGSRTPGARSMMNTLPTGLGWGAPVTREFGELSITLPSRSPFQQSPSPGGSSSAAYSSPMWSEISPPEGQRGGGRRANRTRFTDQQVKVLHDFFEKNSYPKEEDLRQLSKVLNLGPRVIVVWFQNARQKLRKVFENQPPPSEPEEDKSSRFQRTAELNYQCNRCRMVYQRYQELVRHQRQDCYREEFSRQRGKSQEPHTEVCAPAVSAAEVKPIPQDNTYKCGKCPQEFDRFDRWREHQMVHVMNPSVVPSSRQNQFSGSAACPPSARPSHSAEEASDEETDDAAVWERHAQDRRLRTSINPEQLEVLQRTYKLNSTPSRETLEAIARGTGLKKRVVQVWFQNSRARERKSQAVPHMEVPVTYSGPTEIVVKTRVTEPKVGPEVSVELVKTYSKALPSALMARQSGDCDASTRMYSAGFTALRHPVLEARLQASPSQAADAPLDLSKSHASKPPAAIKLATSEASPRSVPPAVRRDVPQLATLPLLPSREDIPWSSRPSMDLTSIPSAPSNPPSAAAAAAVRPPFAVTNKRFRTQMSPGQVSVLRSVFAAYRMPTMAECARLGAEIGLAKRVVQVWFQNSRAKDKKRQLQSGRPPTPTPQGCDLCRVGYGVKCSLQEHLLSRAHIERVQREAERTRAAPPAMGGAAQASGAAGAAGAAASAASSGAAQQPLRSSAAATAASDVRPGPPPPPPVRESADDGAATGSRPASPPEEPSSTGGALLSGLLSKDGASGQPCVSIGDVTCDTVARSPAVGAAAVPMATSVG